MLEISRKRAGRAKALQKAQSRKMKGLKEIPSDRVIILPKDNQGNAVVIDQPQVFGMRVEGQEAFQVVGSSTEIPVEDLDLQITQPLEPEEEPEPTISIDIREEDIQLVVAQTGVTLEEAKNALQQNNGEPAKAILTLRSLSN